MEGHQQHTFQEGVFCFKATKTVKQYWITKSYNF